ncbi:MAG: hypothetical protein NPIRA02_30230 [Nitrospirales bacterium]|nr:MAG: hypothetical protein NPIRA02_30230 [Nitrospirales bacterium]
MKSLSIASVAVSVLIVSSCATQSLPERLPVYWGMSSERWAQAPSNVIPQAEGQAGLLVINDTTASQSAPALSEKAFKGFAHRLQVALGEQFPLLVVKVLDSNSVSHERGGEQFVHVAQQEGLDYLLFAVLSSTEREVSDRFPLQGTQQGVGARGGLLVGVRAENYALVELAFVDGKTGLPVVHANGSAWSVLERLNVPLASNVYPVVRRDLTQPPIYPTEETAYDTLRVVSANDAMKQALMHFQTEWGKDSSP